MFELIFWGIILIMTLIVEFSTAALVSVWFAVGAVFAYVVSLFGANFTVQLGTFTFVTALALFLTFVVFKKRPFKAAEKVAGNAAFIGKTAKVVETIDNESGTGRVLLDEVAWKAVSAEGGIKADSLVKVVSVSGSTLSVVEI